ncbi:MAG: allantoicase [Cellvibrionaceae bacterium]|nr:allantoicase [Cellvibrionaceae bacterium]|tara:strand:- start:8030 stop:9094 length:1065 start_codon:yes stop_codon:yes gene_type:complete
MDPLSAPQEQTHDDRLASRYINLLGRKVGGKALSCSDEWFAPCTNLVNDGRGIFKAGYFVETGQWMDGWESRRSYDRVRPSGLEHDWCILRLGIAGVIRGFDVDTNHFRGNAPEFVSIEAANVTGEIDDDTEWFELLKKSPTQPHQQHLFDLEPCELADQVWTHLRLNIYPDGGVARLRAYGEAKANKNHYIDGELVDLASVVNGGRGLTCSDKFYSSPSNLLMPYPGINMGDGWETKRRRDQNNDWCIVKLGLQGSIRKIIVDTAHFKGNFPDRFSLLATKTQRQDIEAEDIEWQTILPITKLYADQEHLFISEISVDSTAEFTHIKMNIFPDGGVSRLRIFGHPNWSASDTA